MATHLNGPERDFVGRATSVAALIVVSCKLTTINAGSPTADQPLDRRGESEGQGLKGDVR